MLVTTLIVRVLDVHDRLLGWVATPAMARGDGMLWFDGQPSIAIDDDGQACTLSVHWADVNVEVRTAINPSPTVARGQVVHLDVDKPALVVGPMPKGLPPVTIRTPVVIGVPVGVLAARMH